MKVVFVGPSLGNDIGRQREIHSDVEFRAPAACGDILRAAEDGASAIGLVDGYFGDLPSVWHKEILYALEQGIAIGGGASMGALRAAECSPFGMVGIGGIYEDYASGALMDDEAGALIHRPAEMNWTPLSIPWAALFRAHLSARHPRMRLRERAAWPRPAAGDSPRQDRAQACRCAGRARLAGGRHKRRPKDGLELHGHVALGNAALRSHCKSSPASPVTVV